MFAVWYVMFVKYEKFGCSIRGTGDGWVVADGNTIGITRHLFRVACSIWHVFPLSALCALCLV